MQNMSLLLNLFAALPKLFRTEPYICLPFHLSPLQATFLKLAGPQLVQMFIGDGAKLVRDAFALAKEKAPSIIFIDELDAIGTKR